MDIACIIIPAPMPEAHTSVPCARTWRHHTLATTPALTVVGVTLAWSCSYGGYAPTHWYPGAVGLTLVLAAVLLGVRPSIRDLARGAQVALAALALFTAWSFASILWAEAKGTAWDGANRTLLYLVIFAIFALGRLDGAGATAVLGAWTLGILALGVAVLLELPGAVGPGHAVLGPGLAAPIGYANAEACLWLMAAWPALLLASRSALPPVLRGLFAGGALVLADLALLGESRGAVIAAGVCLIVLLGALPGRAQTLMAVVPVVAGAALTAPHALGFLRAGGAAAPTSSDLAGSSSSVLGAALGIGALGGALAVLERRRPSRSVLAPRRKRVPRVLAAATVLLGVACAVLAGGSLAGAVGDEWSSFTHGTVDARTGRGPGADLGGARYDYYRVAVDIIATHPLGGIGADNFAEEYAARGRASEFPAYVHSVELRTLVHTGLVGGLLLGLALIGALCGALRAARLSPVAAAGLMVFAQWFIQGSVDWFWEFPALGGAAFAMLGLACGMPPRRPRATPVRVRARASRLVVLVAAALIGVGCVSLAAPWTSAIETARASRVWPLHPDAAFRQLELAADLNPLSTQPALIEGTIALRLDRLDRAAAAFRRALARDPGEPYATLALGAIAAKLGDRARALEYVTRAAHLNPQDVVTLRSLAVVRAGRPIDIPALLAEYAAVAALAQL
jgi:tetratricopeptide (TPR) repeat protein